MLNIKFILPLKKIRILSFPCPFYQNFSFYHEFVFKRRNFLDVVFLLPQLILQFRSLFELSLFLKIVLCVTLSLVAVVFLLTIAKILFQDRSGPVVTFMFYISAYVNTEIFKCVRNNKSSNNCHLFNAYYVLDIVFILFIYLFKLFKYRYFCYSHFIKQETRQAIAKVPCPESDQLIKWQSCGSTYPLLLDSRMHTFVHYAVLHQLLRKPDLIVCSAMCSSL